MAANPHGQAHAAGVTPARESGGGTARPVAMRLRESTSVQPSRFARRTHRFGRVAVLAIPVFALLAGLSQRSHDAFSTDHAVYSRYLAHGRFEPIGLTTVILLGIFGVLSMAGLTAMLLRGRTRRVAVAGLVAGIAGTIALFVAVGTVIVRTDRVRHALLRLDFAQLAFNAHTTGAASGIVVVGGAVLLTIAWILFGTGVWRTAGMNKADGALLIISAPLLYLGGMVLRVLPTMGSFLLLAAGLGIVLTAGRTSVTGHRPMVVRTPPPAATTLPRTEPAGAPVPLAVRSAPAGNGGAHANRRFKELVRGARGIATAWPVHRPKTVTALGGDGASSPADPAAGLPNGGSNGRPNGKTAGTPAAAASGPPPGPAGPTGPGPSSGAPAEKAGAGRSRKAGRKRRDAAAPVSAELRALEREVAAEIRAAERGAAAAAAETVPGQAAASGKPDDSAAIADYAREAEPGPEGDHTPDQSTGPATPRE